MPLSEAIAGKVHPVHFEPRKEPHPEVLRLQIPMKGWVSQSRSPAFTPLHQRGDREEETEQYSGECKPSPEVSNFRSIWQGEVSYNEGQTARQVEKDARFGSLRLVAVGYVGIQGCGGYLKTENTCK
jgi:hypothetical protein